MAFTGVVDRETFGAEGGQEILESRDDFPDRCDVVALVLKVSFRRTD